MWMLRGTGGQGRTPRSFEERGGGNGRWMEGPVGEDKRPTFICGARVSEWEVGGGGARGWEWEVDGGPKRARTNAPRSFEEMGGG